MDAISSEWEYFNSTKVNPDELRVAIERVFLDKIRIGLMAISQIPLTQVLSKFFVLDSNFASVKFIEHVCSVNSNVISMKSNSGGTTLHIVREKQNPAGPSRSSNKCRAEETLKYLFKSRPDIAKALDKKFEWKDILHVYHFWRKIPKYENEFTLVNWLLVLAKTNSADDFPKYKRSMAINLLLRITKYVASKRRSIVEIVDHLCLEKPGLVDAEFVHEVINSYPEKVKITEDTKNLAISKKIVKAATNTSEPGITNSMSLPGNLDQKVIPLLTLRITFINIHNTSKHVLTERKAKDIVMKNGCFFRYLITLANVRKPKIAESYEGHLQSMIRTFLNRILKACFPRPKSLEKIVEDIGGLQGLVDNKFISDAVSKYNMDFAFVDSGEVALREVVTHEMDPHKHLESTEIFALLYERPSFTHILNAFTSLPEVAKSLLENNSMSFYEWLITLAKRDLEYDYPSIESYLHNQVRKQVYDILSQNTCQMTLHHMHRRICRGFPMLLSPNFLNWCLNRKESQFYVEESWIYRKNQKNNVNDAKEQTKLDVEVSHVIKQIRVSSEINVVVSLLKIIPGHLALKALSKDTCWYDFLENSMKERNDRMKMASLVVEEAKKCVRHWIMRISELSDLICNGLPNFISADVLALILQQNNAGFAMSDSRHGDTLVGIVRVMENGNIAFLNEQDKVFVETVLRCFPSNDSADIETLAGIIQEEFDNAMYLTNDFMKCYLLMFPMMFCVQDCSVILTSLALEQKRAHVSSESPTIVRKRKSAHSKGSRHKKKKKSSKAKITDSNDLDADTNCSREGSDSTDEQVTANPSQDTGAMVAHEDLPTTTTEDSEEECAKLIEALPEQLIADFAMNILLQNNNAVEPQKMVEELVQAALPSQVDRVHESTSSMKLFTKKVFNILNIHLSSFVLVCDSDDLCFENVKLIKAKIAEKPPVSDPCDKFKQAETNSSSNLPSSRDSHVLMHSIVEDESAEKADNEIATIDGVIKCFETSVTASTSKDLSSTEEQEVTGPPELITSPNSLAKMLIDGVIKCFETSVTASTSKDLPSIQELALEKPPGLTTNLNSSAKKPIAPIHNDNCTVQVSAISHPSGICDSSGGHKISTHSSSGQNERDKHFRLFCDQYLKINSNTCSTDHLFDDSYHHLKDERFARYRLVFEGYLYDFLLRNSKSYVFGGLQNEFGVSWITYSNLSSPSFDSSKSQNLSFIRLIPEVVKICYSFMKQQSNFEATITDLCATTENALRHQLDDYPDAEIHPVVRCLVLVTLIRNLRLFCFSVNVPTVYLRERGHGARADRKHSSSANKEIEAVLKNRTLAEAVLHMAEILQMRGPSSAKVLRRIWMARAPPKLCNVFGTGISFTLSLRKYSFIFNQTSDGNVSVNEETLKYLKSRLQPPRQ